MTASKKNSKLLALLLFVIFVFDRILKYLAAQNFTTEGLPLIPGILKFEFYANGGIAFSIPFSGPLLWVLSIALIGVFSYLAIWRDSKRHALLTFAYLFFIFGAVSNLYDRIILGHVIDYLIFFDRSAVNIADGMIIIGAGFLILKSKKPNESLA